MNVNPDSLELLQNLKKMLINIKNPASENFLEELNIAIGINDDILNEIIINEEEE